MAGNSRLSRVVKEAVAEIVRNDLSDPRLRLVTITDARVTNDQSHATVYWSSLDADVLSADPARTGGDQPVSDDAVEAAFEAARGRIQGLLARRLTSRKTPELTFEADPVADQAARVEDLIRRVRNSESTGGATSGSPAASGSAAATAEDVEADPLDDDWTTDSEANGR